MGCAGDILYEDTSWESKGYEKLFNGRDFTGWKVPEGDKGHWKVIDGVIDYDTGREAKGDRRISGAGRAVRARCGRYAMIKSGRRFSERRRRGSL